MNKILIEIDSNNLYCKSCSYREERNCRIFSKYLFFDTDYQDYWRCMECRLSEQDYTNTMICCTNCEEHIRDLKLQQIKVVWQECEKCQYDRLHAKERLEITHDE